MTALKMTVDDALERADDWTRGLTLHPLSDGLRVGILVLATEVRRLRAESERLRAEVERRRADAARYRFLAERCRSTSEHWGGRWSIVIDGPAPAGDDASAIASAIDAARGEP